MLALQYLCQQDCIPMEKEKLVALHTAVPAIAQLLDDYVTSSKQQQTTVLQQKSPEAIIEALKTHAFFENGFESGEAMLEFVTTYLENTNHLHHPRYMGHQVAVPHPLSGIPDWIHGTANNPSSLYEMGPAGGALEGYMINWMLDKLGWFRGTSYADFTQYPENGSGILTHGGSVANLTALSAARAAIAPDTWTEGNPKDLVVIGPSTSHYSIARAISILGLGKNAFVSAAVDQNEVLQVADLKRVYDQQKKEGKRIMAVIANACATSTGLYDPLNEVAAFCQENKLWFHVDGAHGAVALLSDREKQKIKGVEKADSLIWDAHKMMRVPALCTAVLFKNQFHQYNNFKQKGSYVFHSTEVVGMDSMPYTVECTKSALGTKLFWTVALEGEKKLSQYVENCYQLAEDFYRLLKDQMDFEVPYFPQSNILCFRYTGGPLDDDFQLKLRYALIETGRFYITSCDMNNRRYLRVVLINPDTQRNDLIALLQNIRTVAKALISE